MKAMLLEKLGSLRENTTPLTLTEVATPSPRGDDLLLKVSACGVCHTELDEIEGRTPPSKLPMILGHEVVGRVQSVGPDAHCFQTGDRVGVAWIFSACGDCHFCLWLEKEIKSVANVTRNDVSDFLRMAVDMDIRPEFQTFGLADANHALMELKTGKIHGAKVLAIGG